MLSMIGRAALRRAGLGAAQTTTKRAIQSALYIQRPDVTRPTPKNVSSTWSSTRSHATTATKARTPAKPKATTKSKPRRTTAAKPKAQAKKKPKKAAAKKPQPKPKNVLTTEEKAALKKKKDKATRTTQALLDAPAPKLVAAWNVFLSRRLAGQNPDLTRGNSNLRNVASEYKSLSPEQLEELNHEANENLAKHQTELKKFINSHTPDEIRVANLARRYLNRTSGKRLRLFEDPRIPKHPRNPYMLFVADRYASGDFKGVSSNLADKTAIIKKQWEELPASERKKYEDESAQDKIRYAEERQAAFNRA